MVMKRFKAFILAFILGICGVLSGCDFGIADIPTRLIFPDMEEGQDMISYLSSKVLDSYYDTIVTMVTDGIKSELEKGSLDGLIDEIFDGQYEKVIDNLFDANKDKMIQELKGVLKESSGEQANEIFSDPEVLAQIRSNLLSNPELKAQLKADLMDASNPDSLVNQLAQDDRLITSIISNPSFMEALSGNAYFNAYVNWMVQKQLYDAFKDNLLVNYPNPGNPPNPADFN